MAADTDSSSNSVENMIADKKEIERPDEDACQPISDNSTSQSQEVTSESNGSGASGDKSSERPTCQPTKRRPDTDLNHDNWDQEDEPEEKGEFRKASEEQLKERRMLTAKRKQKPDTEASNNPFASLSLPSAPANTGAKPSFSFNFSSNSSPQAPGVPSFDFSCIGANDTKTSKESSSDSTSQPQQKQQEDPMDSNGGDNATTVRPVPTKRRPVTDLNHDNWDQEEEPEEKGEFEKASEDQLKKRKILTAKRKQKPTETSNNPFGSLSFAGSPASMFNFGAPASSPVPSFDFSSTSAVANKAYSDKKDDTTSP